MIVIFQHADTWLVSDLFTEDCDARRLIEPWEMQPQTIVEANDRRSRLIGWQQSDGDGYDSV